MASAAKRKNQIIRTEVARKKRTILQPIAERLCIEIQQSEDIDDLTFKIQQFISLSNDITCPSKHSYTMEQSANMLFTMPLDVEMYLCKRCGFIHFGHEPRVLSMFRARIVELITTKC